jgi:hypothetical protein
VNYGTVVDVTFGELVYMQSEDLALQIGKLAGVLSPGHIRDCKLHDILHSFRQLYASCEIDLFFPPNLNTRVAVQDVAQVAKMNS